jgi:hypothetical protein
MFFTQANPSVRFKSTNNDKFLEGNTVSTFDAALLLQEDNVTEDEYEMQRDFLENYLNVPVAAGFTTYGDINLPSDLKEKLCLKKEFHESFDGREMEVLKILGDFCEEMRAVRNELYNTKL